MHRGAGWLLDGESGWSISAGGGHDRVLWGRNRRRDIGDYQKADRLDEMEMDVPMLSGQRH